MRPDIREQSYLVAQRTGVLAIGEGSIYGHCCAAALGLRIQPVSATPNL
jgi:hypothetical protein